MLCMRNLIPGWCFVDCIKGFKIIHSWDGFSVWSHGKRIHIANPNKFGIEAWLLLCNLDKFIGNNVYNSHGHLVHQCYSAFYHVHPLSNHSWNCNRRKWLYKLMISNQNYFLSFVHKKLNLHFYLVGSRGRCCFWCFGSDDFRNVSW